MKRITLLNSLFVIGLLFTSSVTYGQNWFDVQPESSFWIDGTSNVNSFTCDSDDILGSGRLNTAVTKNVILSSEKRSVANINLEVPVHSFDCGNGRMNSDLYQALKAESYPRIHFELENARILSIPSDSEDWYRLTATGHLTIAGVSRLIEAEVEGKQVADGVYRIRGSKQLNMTDFGIKPPSALLGLVKARDEITVHFDIVAACRLLIAEVRREGLKGWQEYTPPANNKPCDADQVAASK